MALARFRFVLAALLLAIAGDAAASISMPRFEKLEERLKIRPEQKQQFDLAVAATQRALLAVGLTAMQMKERLGQELLKPRPDLRGLLDAHQAMIEQTQTMFREAREEWSRLYKLLDDEQVAIARSFVDENLGRLLRQAQ